MTLGEMKTFLRRRLDDDRTIRWTNAALVDEMNAAARLIAQDAEVNAIWPRLLTTIVGLSIIPGQLGYPIGSDFVMHRKSMRTDVTPNIPCTEIAYEEAGEWTRYNRAFDNRGRLTFYLDTNSSGAAIWTLPTDAKTTATVTVTYQKLCPALTDTTDDANSYALPAAIHEMVPIWACIQLLGGPDNANAAAAVSEFNARRDQMLSTFGRTQRRRQIMANDGIM